MNETSSMAERIEQIKERILKAALRSGRRPEEVRLMGVSKFHGAEAIEEARRAGLSLFGESRVQEAAEKIPPLKAANPELQFHFIGSLQRNKVKEALSLFDGIQSLDRDELIRTLGASVPERKPGGSGGAKRPPEVLLEMRTGEASKSGYADEDALCRGAELVLSFPGLALSGLMTMAPLTEDEDVLRGSFRKLVRAREALLKRFPEVKLPVLSMGMSGDFETAVEEGSTLVRIGTAIFGARKTQGI